MLELFELAPAAAEATMLGAAAQALLEHLHDGALTADEVVRASGIESGAASAALIELELARRVVLEDGVYRVAI